MAGPPNNCTFQQSVVALIGLNLVPMSMALAIAAQNSQKAKVVSIIVAPSPFERVLIDNFCDVFLLRKTTTLLYISVTWPGALLVRHVTLLYLYILSVEK